MLTLKIEVPADRDRAALATLIRGPKTLDTGNAAASTSPKIAAARGNPDGNPQRAWGHPPHGTYALINHRATNKNLAGEYGMHLLLFEPQSGPALMAQAAGRVGLLVYGGPAGQDKRMRRTQGGVRISNGMLDAMVKHIAREDMITLVIESLRKPAWWQFWKSAPATPPLSVTATKAYAAPLDEMSLILELMNGAKRRSRLGSSRDDGRERSPDDDRTNYSSNSSTDTDTFRGGGGQSGGAGASGSWDSATSAGRGVDSSGRIVAAAAVGAAAATVAASAAAAASHESNGGKTMGIADAGSDKNGSGGSDHYGGSSPSSDSSSSSTASSTSY